MRYPELFPCATWEYSSNQANFLSRTAFDSGWTRQRRRFPQDRTAISLQFVMSTTMFKQWADWMLENGYDWFEMLLEDYGPGQLAYLIRLTSGWQWSYNDWGSITITVEAEYQGG